MRKLNLISFTELIANRIESRMHGATIHICENIKNNGIKFYGISVNSGKCNISPCIYLDDYFRRYKKGELEIEEIVEAVLECYEQNKLNYNIDISVFTDYNKVAPLLHGRIVNTEKNKDLLMHMPHRDFLDLSIIYTIDIESDISDGVGSVRITNEHMDYWSITEEDLYAQLKTNMHSNNNSIIKSMTDVLHEMMGRSAGSTFPDSIDEDSSLYILTNNRRVNGAVEIINDDLLKRFAALVEKDFMLLPSSIHEWILMPIDNKTPDTEHLAKTVKDVNDSVVNAEEILSYHVYKYVRETERIIIAA